MSKPEKHKCLFAQLLLLASPKKSQISELDLAAAGRAAAPVVRAAEALGVVDPRHEDDHAVGAVLGGVGATSFKGLN